jgi:uncharacterized membrane protein YdcZ (DUF606 family)
MRALLSGLWSTIVGLLTVVLILWFFVGLIYALDALGSQHWYWYSWWIYGGPIGIVVFFVFSCFYVLGEYIRHIRW